MNWLNYHHLYYFRAIAQNGGITKAAALLSLNQSTLSTQLKQFEQQLGVQLFERKHKALSLTEHGQVALEYANFIFDLGKEFQEIVQSSATVKNVSIRIGTLDSIPKKTVLKLIQKALSYEGCNVSIIEGKPEYIFSELRSHKLDFLLTNFIPSTIDKHKIKYRILHKKPVKIYGHKKHFQKLNSNFPASLDSQPFVLPTFDSKLRYDFDYWLQEKGVSIHPILESQDVEMNYLLANEGHGLVALSQIGFQKNKANNLIEIGKTDFSEELILVGASRKIENQVVHKIFNELTISI